MKSITKQCAICGSDFVIPAYRAKTAKYCSCQCQRNGLKGAPNTYCPICGKHFHVKPSRKGRFATICCSKECNLLWRRERMSGSNNHQFGLRGHLNASFKRKNLVHVNHGKKDILVYVKGHPKPSGQGDRVLLHRYLVELNHGRFDNRYFEVVNGWTILKDGIEVHHIDGDHQNNDINNLMPLTKAEHRKIHNAENAILRNKENGKIDAISSCRSKVKIKLIQGGELPYVASVGAGGADLKATHDCVLEPGQRKLIKTGVCAEIPNGHFAFVMGRSGNTIKRGLHVALGLIDSDYRGEIGVMAFNQSAENIEIIKGDRVAQMIILPYPAIEFEEVSELSETERGTQAYGGSGR